MAFDRQEKKIGLFIDGPNLFSTAQAVGLNIDYEALLNYYRRKGSLLRAYYYTALFERNPSQEQKSMIPMIDWMDYHGYTVVSKLAKSFLDDQGVRRSKGNMDCELILDVVDISPHLTDLVLFSGDGDFASLIKWVQRRGIRTTVVSTLMSKPSPMVADELRRATDLFLDLGENPEKMYQSDLREAITRVDTRER